MSLDDVFQHFGKWKGEVPEGCYANFLGAMSREEYVSNVKSPFRTWESGYPEFTEEYFEWVDLLESVVNAGEEFVMMEIGAGFGRWSVNAAFAAKQKGKKYRILAIEAEPTHFKWMKENIAANGLDLTRVEMVEAAVAVREGEEEFYVGNPTAWYGQQLRAAYKPNLTEDMKKEGVVFEKVKTVTLNKYLERYGRVDLIDMDIQASELDVLRASRDLVNKNVKRVHIGTHYHEIETGLRKLFHELDWEPRYDFECVGDRDTPYGVISFLDGVQTWINPAL